MVIKVDLRTNDTRKRVIQEARHLYLEGGYNYLSMDRIAEILQLKRPTLYYHFPGGKEQLLIETINKVVNELLAAWEEAIRAGHNSRSRLKNIIYSTVENPFPPFLLELGQLSDDVKVTVKQSYSKVVDFLAEVFKEGIESGEIREVSLDIAIHSFFAICDQVEKMLMLQKLFPELEHAAPALELDELIDKIFDLWMRGLEVTPT